MARKVQNASLQTRDRRAKLKTGRRYWVGIHEGVALGYRRGAQGIGSWSLRLLRADGRYILRAVADADDDAKADGAKVLTFTQAKGKANMLAAELAPTAALGAGELAELAKKYLEWFKRVGISSEKRTISVPLSLRGRRIESITANDLRTWLDQTAA